MCLFLIYIVESLKVPLPCIELFLSYGEKLLTRGYKLSGGTVYMHKIN